MVVLLRVVELTSNARPPPTHPFALLPSLLPDDNDPVPIADPTVCDAYARTATEGNCNTNVCPYSILVGKWSECSDACDGTKTRDVTCVNDLIDGAKTILIINM